MPIITGYIGEHKIDIELLDLRSSVNVIPYFVYLELGFRELKASNYTLQLADNRSIRTP